MIGTFVRRKRKIENPGTVNGRLNFELKSWQRVTVLSVVIQEQQGLFFSLQTRGSKRCSQSRVMVMCVLVQTKVFF